MEIRSPMPRAVLRKVEDCSLLEVLTEGRRGRARIRKAVLAHGLDAVEALWHDDLLSVAQYENALRSVGAYRSGTGD